MGKRFLIDSNTLIEYTGKLLPLASHNAITEIINDEFNISFINKIEVLSHRLPNGSMEKFLSFANMYSINTRIMDHTIELRKNFKIKIPDAIIAATALAYNFTLITRNTSDFINIADLEVLNSWNISQ